MVSEMRLKNKLSGTSITGGGGIDIGPILLILDELDAATSLQ